MNAPRDAELAPYVLCDERGGIATLTLNRGDRFNPLSRAMIAALQEQIDRIAADTRLRAVVITGSGSAPRRRQSSLVGPGMPAAKHNAAHDSARAFCRVH